MREIATMAAGRVEIENKNGMMSCCSLLSIKHQWEVEFARFFNFPSSSSSRLKPLPKSRLGCGGTWIASSSIATIRLLGNPSSPGTILTVILGGRILEEHFACNLHFSWPQVACVSQCPTRGSRAVFASYKNCTRQVQKFVMRFATSCHAQTFIDALKDSMKDATDTEHLRSDLGSVASQSEFISSNGLCRAEDATFLDPIATCPQMALNLDYTCKQSTGSQESLLDADCEGNLESLPPSFTALLTDCPAEAELGLVEVPEEVNLKGQIMKYMSDSSFHDMLAKVEEVICEMGGDLAL